MTISRLIPGFDYYIKSYIKAFNLIRDSRKRSVFIMKQQSEVKALKEGKFVIIDDEPCPS